MPTLFNVLICILALVAGVLIGKIYRTHHKAGKNSHYTRDGKIDMSRYKNLSALHDKMEKHEKNKDNKSKKHR